MADTVINPSAVIAAFGSHYVNEGQNMTNLLLRPYEGFGTRAAFTDIPTENTQLKYSAVEVGEILQAYQDAYTPKGSVVFKPVTINLQQVKVDVKFNPNNLLYSWLGFLASEKTDRKTWPFVRWMIEVYLVKQIMEDLEKKVIYKGAAVAVVPGTAGAAIEIMDGIKEQINDAITAGDIVPIATGAPSADPVTWCEQVEEFAKQIPELYWEENIDINMNRTLALRYREGKKKKYNMAWAQETDLNSISLLPSMRVAGRASMSASNKIWGTPKKNAVFATKGFANAQAFELESDDRNIKIWTDFNIGFGLLLKDLVFTNDQELA